LGAGPLSVSGLITNHFSGTKSPIGDSGAFLIIVITSRPNLENLKSHHMSVHITKVH
jgi:hypothetical protein